METKHGFKIHGRYFDHGFRWYHLFVLVDLGNQDWALLADNPNRVPMDVVSPEFFKEYQELPGNGLWGEHAEIPGYGKVPYISE